MSAGASANAERLVGTPVARREDARILRGLAAYLDDHELPRQAHAAFVRSSFARARILAVRSPEAADGLIAVLTAACLLYTSPSPRDRS